MDTATGLQVTVDVGWCYSLLDNVCDYHHLVSNSLLYQQPVVSAEAWCRITCAPGVLSKLQCSECAAAYGVDGVPRNLVLKYNDD